MTSGHSRNCDKKPVLGFTNARESRTRASASSTPHDSFAMTCDAATAACGNLKETSHACMDTRTQVTDGVNGDTYVGNDDGRATGHAGSAVHQSRAPAVACFINKC